MNNQQKPISELEKEIGYTFKNKEIITVALTHSSYSNEMKSHGEKIQFNERLEFLGDSVLSDAFEALLAAIYIDSGENFDEVGRFLLPFIADEIEFITETGVFVDYKTTLQQIVQQANTEKLEYVLVGESGPDHNKKFSVEARLNSNVIGRGEGKTKREAEQIAAHEALVLFGEA